MTHIIKIIHFLAKQGLAFRGNNENKETSNNIGNFKELLEFHVELLPELSKNSSSKVAKYTSAEIQNEVINLIAKQIKTLLLPPCYYAIICDETMDLSRKEMLALCIRSVDDSLNIHENFFGFHRAHVQTAEGIFTTIKEALESDLNLDLQLMKNKNF